MPPEDVPLMGWTSPVPAPPTATTTTTATTNAGRGGHGASRQLPMPSAGSAAAVGLWGALGAALSLSIPVPHPPHTSDPHLPTPIAGLAACEGLRSLDVCFTDGGPETAGVLGAPLIRDLATLTALEHLEVWNVSVGMRQAGRLVELATLGAVHGDARQ